MAKEKTQNINTPLGKDSKDVDMATANEGWESFMIDVLFVSRISTRA